MAIRRLVTKSASKVKNRVNMTTVQEDGQAVWINSSLTIIEQVTIYVPVKILNVMRSIESKFKGSKLEFGIYVKGKYEGTSVIVDESFYVPKQYVTAASIDFDEDGNGEFNGVIHRHPNGCISFSGQDKRSINQNHDFSILYVGSSMPTGVVNYELKNMDGRVQLPAKIVIVDPDVDSDIDINNIQPRTVRYVKDSTSSIHMNQKDSDNLPRFGSFDTSELYDEFPGLFNEDSDDPDDPDDMSISKVNIDRFMGINDL